MEENNHLKSNCTALEGQIIDLKEEIRILQEKLAQSVARYEDVISASPKSSRASGVFAETSPRQSILEQGAVGTPKNASFFKSEATPKRNNNTPLQFKTLSSKQPQRHNIAHKVLEKSIVKGTGTQPAESGSKGVANGNSENNKDLQKKPNEIRVSELSFEQAAGSQKINVNQAGELAKDQDIDSKQGEDINQEAGQGYDQADQREVAEDKDDKEAYSKQSLTQINDLSQAKIELPITDSNNNLEADVIDSDREQKMEAYNTFGLLSDKTANPFMKIDRFLIAANLTPDHLSNYIRSKNSILSKLPIHLKTSTIHEFNTRPTDLASEENRFSSKIPILSASINETNQTPENRKFPLQGHYRYMTSQQDLQPNNSTTNTSINHITKNSSEGQTLRSELASMKFRANKVIGRITDRAAEANSNSSITTPKGYLRGVRDDQSSFLRQQRRINSPSSNYFVGDSSSHISGSFIDPLSQNAKYSQDYNSKSLALHLSSEIDPAILNSTRSHVDKELSSREHQTTDPSTERINKLQEQQQQREVAKLKEERELQEVFSGLQQKIAYIPRVKKIFAKLAQKNNPLISEQDLENGNFDVDYSLFKEYMSNFKETHRRCGDDCPHLRRFYEKVGYTRLRKREIFALSITEIAKLPIIRRKIRI